MWGADAKELVVVGVHEAVGRVGLARHVSVLQVQPVQAAAAGVRQAEGDRARARPSPLQDCKLPLSSVFHKIDVMT